MTTTVFVYIVKQGNWYHIYNAITHKAVKVNLSSADSVSKYCRANSLHITEWKNA